jgi:hypothetical protein
MTIEQTSGSQHIKMFSAFKEALIKLHREDRELLSKKKKRAGVSHRLALYLERLLPFALYIDLGYEVKLKNGEIYPDILIHGRRGDISMAVFWQDGYLSKSEQEEIKKFTEETGCALTLAFSLLPEKEYFLIYRFEDNYIQYLHVDKETGADMFLKQCEEGTEVEKEPQPTLFKLSGTRKRKKKATSSPEPVTDQ